MIAAATVEQAGFGSANEDQVGQQVLPPDLVSKVFDGERVPLPQNKDGAVAREDFRIYLDTLHAQAMRDCGA